LVATLEKHQDSLVNVYETAAEAGFRWPTAMTREAYDLVVAHKNENEQDGRLWNVCLAAYYAVANLDHETDRVEFGVFVEVEDDGELREEMASLEIIGSKDDSGWHLTIQTL